VQTLTLEAAQAQSWDVIVIGAGLGGGLLGRRLTEQGLSVLFVEHGVAGPDAEQQIYLGEIRHPEARRIRGLWPGKVEAHLNGVATQFHGSFGAGVGGSSVFYAAALERPERHDLDEDPTLPHPTGGWPVGYDAFLPYYALATNWLSLRGTPDPLSDTPNPNLRDPLPMTSADADMMAHMEHKGLHPYRLHLAVRYADHCRKCFGAKCPWHCKMDGRSAGVVPALATGRAGLLTECAVAEILEDGTGVTGIRLKEGNTILRARAYALCAGTLGSARLLLASKSHNPAGCANSSDWVGRGLMFHLNEVLLIWPRRKSKTAPEFGKSISLRDFYSSKGQRFGLVQSMGLDAGHGNIMRYLSQIYDQSILRRFERPRKLLHIPAMLASRLFGKAAIFVGIIEDFAYPENRVVLHPDNPEMPCFHYTYHPELLQRRKAFRRTFSRAFRGQRRFMATIQPTLNYGHPVGSLRFGTDPTTSVLRPDCRTHDLNNLYVADASFMPSSLGVNPSLTIAANALRVADHMVAALTQKAGPDGT